MEKLLYTAIKRSVFGRLFVYVIQFLALAVYARIFTPEEFGIIAAVQVFIIFFQMIADIGIGPAIINEKNFLPKQRDGIFTVTFLIGIIFSFLFYVLSFYIDDFYSHYDYSTISVIVSISILFYSLSIVPLTSLNKDAKFFDIAKVDSLVEICCLCIVYILYKLGFGVLALASKGLIQGMFRFLFLLFLSNKTSIGRAHFGREIYHIKKIAKFAGYQFSFNLVNYFSRNLDNILIAKYFGATSLGLYEKSYQLMRYPLLLTTSAMTPAIQPILTNFNKDVCLISREHNKLAVKLLFLSLLMSVFLYTNTLSLIYLLLGEQWGEIESILKIFCLMIPIQAVMSTSGSFFQVMNKPNLLFYTGLVSSIFNVSAIVTGVSLGEIEYIAALLVCSFFFSFIQVYFVLFKFVFRKSIVSFLLNLFSTFRVSLYPIGMYLFLGYVFSFYVDDMYLMLILNVIFAFSSLILFRKLIMRLFLMELK
ncbi:oligosaccharide flippase family protein [Vibrio parahaemolyticus]|nr:oligosaccharide flippase family protein [Vibrio parahaemolyticus]